MEFKKALEQRMKDLSTAAVGSTSGLIPYVVTFDDHLMDWPLDQLPAIVTFVKNKSKEFDEIGKTFGEWVWYGHIYYLDLTKPGETWDDGNDRRDLILTVLEEALEGNHFLADVTGPLINQNPRGVIESAYMVDVVDVVFDQTGQEEYYTFTAEMYISVHTQKS